MTRMVVGLAAMVLMLSAAAPAEGATLTLVNETGRTLVPYPFDASAGQRVRDAANALDQGESAAIDVTGFDPVYVYEPGVSMTGTDANGFRIGLRLSETPPIVHYELFHYNVLPDQAGPAPILLDELEEDVTPYLPDLVMTVDANWKSS